MYVKKIQSGDVLFWSKVGFIVLFSSSFSTQRSLIRFTLQKKRGGRGDNRQGSRYSYCELQIDGCRCRHQTTVFGFIIPPCTITPSSKKGIRIKDYYYLQRWTGRMSFLPFLLLLLLLLLLLPRYPSGQKDRRRCHDHEYHPSTSSRRVCDAPQSS